MSKIVGWDIETYKLSAHEEGAELLSSAVVYDGGAVAELARDGMPVSRELLDDPDVILVGFNTLSFDIPYWEAMTGRQIRSKFCDLKVAQSLLNSEKMPNDLKTASWERLGVKLDESMKAQRKDLRKVSESALLKYNLEDADVCYRMYQGYMDELEREGLTNLFWWLMDAARTLNNMTFRGVPIDKEWLEEHQRALEPETAHMEYELLRRLGYFESEEHMTRILDVVRPKRRKHVTKGNKRYPSKPPETDINFGSPKQVSLLLYDYLGLPVVSRNKKSGAPKTDAKAMTLLKYDSRVKQRTKDYLKLLVKFREAKKLSSTYLEKLRTTHPSALDGRIHCTYHIGRGTDASGNSKGARTGRTSSSNPNLQNQPNDFRVQGAFIADPGQLIGYADYGQLEIRVLAVLAKVLPLLEAFRRGEDVHTFTLGLVKGVLYEAAKQRVDSGAWKSERTAIKRVQFGVGYGAGPTTIQFALREMGIDVSVAYCQNLINDWYERYPEFAEWKEKQEVIARKTGRAYNIFGGYRTVSPEQLRGQQWQVDAALRSAINSMIQTPAAYIGIMALQNLENAGILPRLTVHDSVLFFYPKDTDEAILREKVQRLMVDDVNDRLEREFNIPALPLEVDIELGFTRWGQKT